jgi:ferredoxin
MNRFKELKTILDSGRYFKVVCGAGNEDPDEVYRLTLVYTLAGALGIDVSANVEVVESSMKGVTRAIELAPSLGIKIKTRPFINVSVGLKGDPHVRKARIIEEVCSQCGACFDHCDQEAIEEPDYKIIEHRCIGCGKCAENCEVGAIEFLTKKIDFNDILPRCLKAGAENFELHAIIKDDSLVMRDWRILAGILPNQFISMCLDRSELSDNHLAARVRQAGEIVGERLIIQADGAPMSGGSDDFNTTLQAVACADIILKSKTQAKILLSGGTNSKTGELAQMCGVKFHGVSIGTFARNLVRQDISAEGFDENPGSIMSAVEKATALVNSSIIGKQI